MSIIINQMKIYLTTLMVELALVKPSWLFIVAVRKVAEGASMTLLRLTWLLEARKTMNRIIMLLIINSIIIITIV